ncbi:MAG: hypothetical protein ABJA57_08190 [Ginsengibacter sp.]
MKKQFILLSTAVMFLFTACNDETKTDTTTTNSDSTVVAAPDTSNMATTTTVTTTTTTTIPNFDHRSFVSLKTKKPIKLRQDTVTHVYVDMTTNEQPYYYYDPATHDTFDYKGRMVNNALVMNNGEYTIDETRISNVPATAPATGDYKMKQSGDKMKEKTDTSKMKMDNNKMKVKIK